VFGSFEWGHQLFLEAVAYKAIGFFNFSICLEVRNGCEIELDAQGFAVVLELLRLELCPVAVMILLGTPKRKTIDLMKLTAVVIAKKEKS
jgi:hypothetical protein